MAISKLKCVPLGQVGVGALTADATIRACKIRLQVIAVSVGKAYFGTVGLNKSTLAGVIKEFVPTPAGAIDDSYDLDDQASPINGYQGQDLLVLADYGVDFATGGEKLLVTYWYHGNN